MDHEVIPHYGSDPVLGGRPPKISEESTQMFERCAKAFMPVDQACILAGISDKTYYEYMKAAAAYDQASPEERKKMPSWYKSAPVLRNRIQKARAISELEHVEACSNSADKGWVAKMTLISRRIPERYGEKLSRGDAQTTTVNLLTVKDALQAIDAQIADRHAIEVVPEQEQGSPE